MSLFHSGDCGVALCGVWQKMQTRFSVRARTVPGPVTERLCRVPTMSDVPCARAAPPARAPAAASAAAAMTNVAAARAAFQIHATGGRVISGGSLCPRRRVRHRDPEDLDAMVVGVADVELVPVADEQPGREPELSEVGAAPDERQQEAAIPVEELHVV